MKKKHRSISQIVYNHCYHMERMREWAKTQTKYPPTHSTWVNNFVKQSLYFWTEVNPVASVNAYISFKLRPVSVIKKENNHD